MEIGNDEHQNTKTPKRDDANQNDEHDDRMQNTNHPNMTCKLKQQT